jgi:AbrB family looped-hinge helix DNA binding protein
MSVAIATMTSKHQLTVPKELREDFKLKPGDKLIFTKRGDDVVVTPLKGNPQAMLEYLRRDLKEDVDIMELHAEFEADDEFR